MVEPCQSDGERTRRNLLKIGAKLGGVAAAATLGVIAVNKHAEACCLFPCFLRGTRVMTADGERKVEDLAIGDLLPTHFLGLQPIKWIGRFSYKRSDPAKPWVKDFLPVRVVRSALAPNVPARDLYVTGGHALLIDDALVPAESLLNGTTIARAPCEHLDELEFFHIKLENHNVIVAEGAPVETLLGDGGAAQNFGEYIRLYGEQMGAEEPCAPILAFKGGRSEVKSRLRSALSPWTDRRTKLDVIRDRIEERGIMMTRGASVI